MCFKQVCDVSANVGSADASLVVAFVCKVNKFAAPAGSVENRLVPWRTFSPSSPPLAAASPQERKLFGSSGQRAGFARVSVPRVS